MLNIYTCIKSLYNFRKRGGCNTAVKYFHQGLRIGIALILILGLFQVISVNVISVPENTTSRGNSARQVDEWPMFRHDMNRTGNTTSIAPNANNIIWTHQTPQGGYTWGYSGSPAVADGTVFQGGGSPDIVRAIDVQTGLQDWQRPMGRVTSSCTVANDHVYVGSYDFRLYSLVQATGAVEWQPNLNEYIDSSPVVYNGKVYVGTGQGDYIATKPCKFYCLDEANGNILWDFQAQGQVVASPTIVNDRVIFGSYDGNVYCIPAADPNSDGQIDNTEVLWSFSTGERIVSSAAVENDVIFLGTIGGNIYALPLYDPNNDGTINNTEIIWQFATDNEVWGSPGLANGRVFIGSHDYYVYCLPQEDPNGDGQITEDELHWKYRTTDKLWSSPTIAGGKVFIGSEDYKLWALSEETGAFIWNYTMPLQSEPFGSELLYSTPAVVDGRIFIGNYDLTLYCFGNDTDPTPPAVTNAMPLNNSVDVTPNTDIEVNFDEELCAALITDSSLVLKSSTGKRSSGFVSYNDLTNKLVFNPDNDLTPNETYTVRLKAQYFQDYAGNFLDGNDNGVVDPLPVDDYIWHFNTSKLVGRIPKLQDCSVTPESGYIKTDFEVFVTYTDEDGNAPLSPNGYIKIFFDGSLDGQELGWAYDANIPDSDLIDRDYTNGELFHFVTTLDSVGTHNFYVECSDGFNTNRTPVYDLPNVHNSPPWINIYTKYVIEDQEYQFDLLNYVTDIDNDTSDLVFSENSNYCQIENNNLLKCLYTSESPTYEIVNITVTDGINEVWQDVLFVIKPNNDGPMLKPNITSLPPVTVYEDSMYIYKLDQYITDPDTPIEMLEVTVESEYIEPEHITSIGLDLYLLYPYPQSDESWELSISDGTNILKLELNVSVIPVNDPPRIYLPLLMLKVYEETESTFGILPYVYDEETSKVDLLLKVKSKYLGEIEIKELGFFTLFYPEGIVEDEINVTISDGIFNASQILHVTIIPINDPPDLSNPRADLVKMITKNKTRFNFLVDYHDEDMINTNFPDPKVDLVLNGEVYGLTMLGVQNLEGTIKLYGTTLELTQGTYNYHFECDDNTGEANSFNNTLEKTLEVSESGGEPTEEDPGAETETDGFSLVLLLLFLIIIAVLILINIWLFMRQRRQQRPAAPAPADEQLAEPVEQPPKTTKPTVPDSASEAESTSDETVPPEAPLAQPVAEPSEPETTQPEPPLEEPPETPKENGGEGE